MENQDKLKFEVKTFSDGKTLEKRIYIGGELFDFEIDQESLEWASKMGPEYLRKAQEDIENYFAECVSDFIGRRVSVRDVQIATKTGLI